MLKKLSLFIAGGICVALVGMAAASMANSNGEQTAQGDVHEVFLGPSNIDEVYFVGSDDGANIDSLVWNWKAGRYDFRRMRTDGSLSPATDSGLAEAGHQTRGLASAVDESGREWVALGTHFGYLSGGHFVDVPLASPRRRTPSTVLSVRADNREAWTSSPVTSIASDGRGAVWVSRDFVPALLRVDANTGVQSEVEVPGMSGVPGYLHETRDGLYMSSYRRAQQTDPVRRYLYDPSKEAAHVVAPSGYIANVGANGISVVDPEAPVSVTRMSAGLSDTIVLPEMADDPRAIIASSPDGGYWYAATSPMQIMFFNPASGRKKAFQLPYEDVGASEPGTTPWPNILSEYIDAEGRLWLSYAHGYVHVVCLTP